MGEGFDVVLVAHNIYLQLIQGGGVLALVGFVVFATGIMRSTRTVTCGELLRAGIPQALLAASTAAMGTWLLYGLVGNALYDRYLYAPAGFVLAIGLVSRARSADPVTNGAADGA